MIIYANDIFDFAKIITGSDFGPSTPLLKGTSSAVDAPKSKSITTGLGLWRRWFRADSNLIIR